MRSLMQDHRARHTTGRAIPGVAGTGSPGDRRAASCMSPVARATEQHTFRTGGGRMTH